MNKNSLLLHSCCAHCAAYTVNYFGGQGYKVSALWYNPNIHPYPEHQNRLQSMKSLAEKINLPLIINQDHDFISYFREVVGHENDRCRYCFRLRLSKTADTALEMGFGAFTTTLLISPHQKHDLILEIGNELSRQKGIDFLYVDLRKRYSDSRRLTKPLELYRQQYCGCIYSEWERYTNTKIE